MAELTVLCLRRKFTGVERGRNLSALPFCASCWGHRSPHQHYLAFAFRSQSPWVSQVEPERRSCSNSCMYRGHPLAMEAWSSSRGRGDGGNWWNQEHVVEMQGAVGQADLWEHMCPVQTCPFRSLTRPASSPSEFYLRTPLH